MSSRDRVHNFPEWEWSITRIVCSQKLFEQANEILGFRISDIMFRGTEEDLKQTKVTQPAVFLHSIIAYRSH